MDNHEKLRGFVDQAWSFLTWCYIPQSSFDLHLHSQTIYVWELLGFIFCLRLRFRVSLSWKVPSTIGLHRLPCICPRSAIFSGKNIDLNDDASSSGVSVSFPTFNEPSGTTMESEERDRLGPKQCTIWVSATLRRAAGSGSAILSTDGPIRLNHNLCLSLNGPKEKGCHCRCFFPQTFAYNC